ncbi:hypothetical protein [Pararhizobium mangrovi]|uniref:Uncharacterized protein n=1 Tax=Pararhizobium mangrovi TaxID=2590452 RepID=A0A506U6Z4_9HYPH|nr:hypothetical protein [Pararhizobium mangrovi]TPW28389.1 hypothetical protein FJU11_09575 [Pararhizobium mangrovi]
METALVDPGDRYAPREASFLRMIDTPSGTIKLNGIGCEGIDTLDAVTIDDAERTIRGSGDGSEPTDHYGAGFAILHRGEEALWLLSSWWRSGGIATEDLWRADLSSRSSRFHAVEEKVMACVWELGVIDFERRAWIETAMAGRPIPEYLAARLPRSDV